MADSDEEEMRAMRSSNRYTPTARKPAPALGVKVTPDVPLPGAQGGDDSDGEMPTEDMAELKGFNMPLSFGKQKPVRNVGPQVHQANVRKARGEKPVAKGVQFGPRVTDPAAKAAAKARLNRAEKAAEPTPVPGPEEDDEEPIGPIIPQGIREAPVQEEDELPEPGRELEVIPVTHEVNVPCYDKPVTALGLDPKGSRMIAGTLDGTLKFFDFHGMCETKEAFRSTEPVAGKMVHSVSFSPTGGQVLVVSADAQARIYDRDGSSGGGASQPFRSTRRKTQEELATSSYTPVQMTVLGDMYVRQMEHTKGHTQVLTSGMWHPFRGELFLTASLDGTMRMWDMNADPVGMDQQLPCVHVLKTVDRRNVCVGGGSGKQGGLFPACCCYSPTDAKKLVAGCSDGSVQLFFDKARFMRPDRILRTAHSESVTAVGFVPEGMESQLLITRSLDNTMKIWDCRMMSDAKGPVKVFEDLRTSHDKTGLCTSPDGRYIVTGTSLTKNALGSATLRVYDAKTMSLVKSLDFGKKSVLQLAWPKELNQILVSTSAGNVVMLYSPFSSRKGALHFVGKKAKTKSAFGQLEDAGVGPIFNMTDPAEMQRFYSTSHGDMTKIRRTEARASNKSLTPLRPEESGTKMPDQKFGDFAAAALKAGATTLHLNSTRVTDTDSQKALLEYQDKISAAQSSMLVDTAYSKTQPKKILDWSEDVSEGDKRMALAMKGEFCRKCGMKACRCVDYSRYGQAKRPRTS